MKYILLLINNKTSEIVEFHEVATGEICHGIRRSLTNRALVLGLEGRIVQAKVVREIGLPLEK